jgi:anthranilate phosphoribosyltransferase
MVESDLRAFGAHIQTLIQGGNLTRGEVYSCFGDVLQSKQPDLHQGAFLAALAAKGETAEEVAGVWQAVVEFDTVVSPVAGDGPLVENSGTGMDSLKTFNVSSAAGIVAAACGARVARHGARALTSMRGTVDILEGVGVDVECDASTVSRSIETIGIGLFNGMSPQVHPSGLGRILSQIRFGSTLNIAASLANPARPTTALRGVYSETMLDSVMQVMREIGYERALVVHGRDDVHAGGMDEISITGETDVRAFGLSGWSATCIRPEDFGMKTARYEEVAAVPDDSVARRGFLRVLAGQEHGACIDFTCLNAAGILVAAGTVDSFEEGISQSRQAIESGSAIEKLQDWVVAQSGASHQGESCLQRCLELADVA